MDKLEKLITELEGFKEELTKNMNMSYGSPDLNMAKDEPHKDDPNHEAKEKKIASKVKEEAEKILDMHKEESGKVNLNNPYNDKAKAGKSEAGRNDKNDKEPELKAPDVGGAKRSQPSIKKGEMEVCKWDANGQWSLKKDAVNPKLAPKDVKVKQLQQQIDSGTYKPDTGKIADKIIQHPTNPLKKGNEHTEVLEKGVKLHPSIQKLKDAGHDLMDAHTEAYNKAHPKTSHIFTSENSAKRDHMTDSYKHWKQHGKVLVDDNPKSFPNEWGN